MARLARGHAMPQAAYVSMARRGRHADERDVAFIFFLMCYRVR